MGVTRDCGDGYAQPGLSEDIAIAQCLASVGSQPCGTAVLYSNGYRRCTSGTAEICRIWSGASRSIAPAIPICHWSYLARKPGRGGHRSFASGHGRCPGTCAVVAASLFAVPQRGRCPAGELALLVSHPDGTCGFRGTCEHGCPFRETFFQPKHCRKLWAG